MKVMHIAVVSSLLFASCGWAGAQSAQSGNTQPSAQTPAPAPAPLHLNSIAPPKKIEFPPANPKNFTTSSPTAAEVNAFLKQLWGYDPNRVWEVVGIQSTKAPNISRVTVEVGEQGISHAPAVTVFFVTPDGNHAIAGNDIVSFGPHPFAANRRQLEQRADGPYRGSASKNLELVEFADLECPHCAEAASTVDRLVKDFPNARIVFQNFPLTNVHPAAQKAAEYGVCVEQQKGTATFFKYVQAVFDTQAGLAKNADQTLTSAVTKAGADPTQVSSCAAGAEAKTKVAASVKLGMDLGVDQTPFLFVNGRPIPLGGIPYSTLKNIITFVQTQAGGAQTAGE